ncbi:MAG: RDD family protein [Pseudomonadales bacterium]|nr:RDD family protein [Pseudomonadales bacterium]
MTCELSGDVTTPRYVGFWARMLAFIVDSIAAFLLMMPLSLGSGSLLVNDFSKPNALQDALIASLPGALLETLILAALFIGFWIYFAATPGKLLVHSYIVNAKTFQRAKTSQLVIRYLGYFASIATFGLGFIWIGIDSRKQSFHDKLASTVVVYDKPNDE